MCVFVCVLRRSFCRYGVARWLWLFVVLAALNVPDKLLQYFHDQIVAFMTAHDPQPLYQVNYPLLH